MAKQRIKKIDIDNEESIEIKKVVKNSLTNEVIFDKKKLIVESDNLNTAYTIFSLQNLTDKYSLDYDRLLIILYLKELNLFSLRIKVLDRSILLRSFIPSGFIVEDYSNNNKKLFKLTDKSIRIVKEFYDSLSNNSSFLSKNREAELDVDSKVKSVLGDYFNI